MSFPSSPTNGQSAIVNGILYNYNSANDTWTKAILANVNDDVVYTANTQTVLGQKTFSAPAKFTDETKIKALLQKATIVAAAPAAVENIDIVEQTVQFFTSVTTNNFELNIINANKLVVGESATVSCIILNTLSTSHFINKVRTDSVAQIVKWAGGITPTAGFSGFNIYTFTVIKTNTNQYTVLGNLIDAGPITKQIFLTTTGAGTWTVPADWTNNNTIEVIGGGASGRISASNPCGGGGGGAYSAISNLSLTIGASVSYSVGTGGAASGANGGDTWFNGITLAASSVGAKGGTSTNNGTGGAGGDAASGVGTVKYSGGRGGNAPANNRNGGGGGAAGPNGAGGNGGNGNNTGGGGGGGGANGGANGGDASSSTVLAGVGGNNRLGFGGGTAGVGAHGAGGDGNNGGGGGGNATGSGIAGDGSQEAVWFDTNGTAYGPGGGGGGRGGGNSGYPGGNGGGYGGGGAGYPESGEGTGSQGLIVITYYTI